jgi:D-arabinose 1-dehydrogenase-like Zn-dependent alcohol dehydrogenase
MLIRALGYVARQTFSRLKLLDFECEEARSREVEIGILYDGVCRLDT